MKKYLLILFLLLPINAYAWNVTSACLAQYSMNENAANSTVADSCASLTGTLFKPGFAVNTSVVHATGIVGTGSFLFDGTTTTYGIDIGTHSALSFARTDPWSVSAWFKTSDNSHEGDIISKMDNNSGGAGWAVEMSSGKIQALIINTASSNWIQQLSTNTYNDGLKHHLVVTNSGSSTAAGLTFYIDGSPVAKASPIADNLSSAISYTNALPAVGIRNCVALGSSQPFFGTLDEVRVFNRVLTSDEVSGLYNGGSGTEASSGTSNSGAFFQLF